jgi:hypothetical protein
MRAALRKLSTLNKQVVIRSIFFSFVFIAFFVFVLYVLINSPA